MSRVVRVVVGAVLVVGSFFMGGTTWPAVVRLLGSTLLASSTKPKTPKQNRATEQRLTTSLEPEEFRKIVFGETAMGADVRYWEAWGPESRNYDQVLAAATHKIESFGAFYVDDELVTFSGNNATGAYAGVLTRLTSVEGSTSTNLAAGGGGIWRVDGADRPSMTGCAHYVLRWVFDQEKLPRGIPNRITQVGKGALLYDPRKDSTRGGSGSHRADDQSTWQYSPTDSNGVAIGRNPALQILWYLIGWRITNPESSPVESILVAGQGVPLSSIDFDSFITAANLCEEEGYYADCILSTGSDHEANLNILTAACAGDLSDAGGRYQLRIAHDDTAYPVTSFDENDIMGEFEWTPKVSMSNQFNQAHGTFVDPDTLYQRRSYPVVRDAAYEAEDGYRRRQPFNYDAVQDSDQAQKLARLELNKSRRQGVFQAPFSWKAMRTKLYDPVTLSLPRLGFTNKIFRVIDIRIDPMGPIWLILREDDPAVYTPGTVLPLPPPAEGAGYDPRDVPAPLADDWNAVGGVIGTPGGVTQPGIIVDASPPPLGFTGVWIEYRRGTSGSWTEWYQGPPEGANYTISGLVAGADDYYVSIRYRNAFGVWGSDNDRLILGPLTVGDLVAGDALLPSETLDDIRERIDESKATAAEAFESLIDRFNPAGWPSSNLVDAVDGSTQILAQAGQENLIRDPRNRNGISDQWASDQGAVRWTSDPRRGGLLEAAATGASQSFQLRLWQGGPEEQAFEILPGARLAISMELAVTGAASARSIAVSFLDADGDVTGSTVSLTTDLGGGRIGGFVEPGSIPSDARRFRARASTVSTGAGALTLSVLDPYIGKASPTQAAVPEFVEIQDERLVQVRKDAIVTSDEASLTLIATARSNLGISRAGLALSASEANATAILGVQSDLTDLDTTVSGQATAISSLDTRVTSAEGTISAQGTAITDVTARVDDIEDDLPPLQASSTLFLQAFAQNDPPELRAVFALEADIDGAITGIYGIADQSSNDLIFQADNFFFKGASTNLQPFRIIGNNAFFASPVHVDDGAMTPLVRGIYGPLADNMVLWIGSPSETSATASLANARFALTDRGAYYGKRSATAGTTVIVPNEASDTNARVICVLPLVDVEPINLLQLSRTRIVGASPPGQAPGSGLTGASFTVALAIFPNGSVSVAPGDDFNPTSIAGRQTLVTAPNGAQVSRSAGDVWSLTDLFTRQTSRFITPTDLNDGVIVMYAWRDASPGDTDLRLDASSEIVLHLITNQPLV